MVGRSLSSKDILWQSVVLGKRACDRNALASITGNSETSFKHKFNEQRATAKVFRARKIKIQHPHNLTSMP